MKMKREEVIAISGNNPTSNIVSCALLHAVSSANKMEKVTKRLDWEHKEEFDVKLTIDGMDLDLQHVCDRWRADVDRQIELKAIELIEDKIGDLKNGCDDMLNGIKRAMLKNVKNLTINLDDDSEYA